MRILWVSDSPLLGTGFGRVTREITTRLAKVPGLQVACLAWGHDGWPYDRDRSPIVLYPSPPASQGAANFERAVSDFQPDVVITLGEMWMIDWLPAHPVRPRFKWISYVPVDGEPFYPPWEAAMKNADEIVAMSEFGRQVCHSGVPSRRIHLIPHGVDPEVFRPLPERARLKAHERFRGKYVVGCVARNQPRKQIPALVKAVAALAARFDNLHLYLHMNPCDLGYDIVTLLHRYRLEGKADVSGPNFALDQPLNDEQLNRLYNLFDVTVLPTAGEGFGLPIIESFAAGVPVVATDYSACTELVQGRGELVRVLTTVTTGTNLIEQAVIDVEHLASCIEKLYRDPALAADYGKAGIAFAQSLSWDALLPKWIEAIRLASRAPNAIENGSGRGDDRQLTIAKGGIA